MGITVTLRGGSGDMLKSVYDPNLDGKIADAELIAQPQDLSVSLDKVTYDGDADGKIALANLNQVANTLSAEVMDGYFNPGESSRTSTAYAALLNRGFCVKKGGDYKFGAKIRCANASYIAYLGYRINGGSWVDIDTTNSTALIEKKMSSAITLNDGDVVEMGLKGASASYSVYIERILSWISKVNRID
jgi:hypothetical protein